MCLIGPCDIAGCNDYDSPPLESSGLYEFVYSPVFQDNAEYEEQDSKSIVHDICWHFARAHAGPYPFEDCHGKRVNRP